MSTYKMRHTQIEYARHVDGTPGYAWDYQTGCRHQENGVCKVKNCWARQQLCRRHDDFTPKLHPERLLAPLYKKEPSIVLVNFKGDGFGDWVDPNMDIGSQNIPITVNGEQQVFHSNKVLNKTVIDVVTVCPQHRFVFLTKAPQNYQKWSTEWPDNCWLGATVTDEASFVATVFDSFRKPKLNAHLWLSIEPLTVPIQPCKDDMNALKYAGIEWIIIGSQTHPYRPPEISWVKEIVDAADKAGIPVWEKNNLDTLLKRPLTQHLPEGLILK